MLRLVAPPFARVRALQARRGAAWLAALDETQDGFDDVVCAPLPELARPPLGKLEELADAGPFAATPFERADARHGFDRWVPRTPAAAAAFWFGAHGVRLPGGGGGDDGGAPLAYARVRWNGAATCAAYPTLCLARSVAVVAAATRARGAELVSRLREDAAAALAGMRADAGALAPAARGFGAAVATPAATRDGGALFVPASAAATRDGGALFMPASAAALFAAPATELAASAPAASPSRPQTTAHDPASPPADDDDAEAARRAKLERKERKRQKKAAKEAERAAQQVAA